MAASEARSGEPGDAAAGWAHEIVVEVPFRDLDALGHVNHTLFLRYMEDVRTIYYMRVAGITDPTKLDMIMAEVTCTYHAPAGFGERLRVGVRPHSIGTKSFVWVYRVWSEATGQTLATGQSVLVAFDYEAGRTKPVNPKIRAECERWLGGSAAPARETGSSDDGA